jgi:hypothetical protein
MPLENAHSLVFKVPDGWFAEGAHYEFRMAYPFSSYTYRTKSIVVKVFDAAPRLISSPLVTATSAVIHVMWTPPEYFSNLIGYFMQIYESLPRGVRRAALNEKLIGGLTLSLIQTSPSIGCTESPELPCLTPFTNYRIAVPAIRDDGTDDPFSTVASTKEIALPFSIMASTGETAPSFSSTFRVTLSAYGLAVSRSCSSKHLLSQRRMMRFLPKTSIKASSGVQPMRRAHSII